MVDKNLQLEYFALVERTIGNFQSRFDIFLYIGEQNGYGGIQRN